MFLESCQNQPKVVLRKFDQSLANILSPDLLLLDEFEFGHEGLEGYAATLRKDQLEVKTACGNQFDPKEVYRWFEFFDGASYASKSLELRNVSTRGPVGALTYVDNERIAYADPSCSRHQAARKGHLPIAKNPSKALRLDENNKPTAFEVTHSEIHAEAQLAETGYVSAPPGARNHTNSARHGGYR